MELYGLFLLFILDKYCKLNYVYFYLLNYVCGLVFQFRIKKNKLKNVWRATAKLYIINIYSCLKIMLRFGCDLGGY